MAKLTELCSNIPTSILRDQTIREINRRKALSYLGRMESLRQEGRVFDRCVQWRPDKGKTKNRFTTEQAGTIGSIVVGIRTGRHSVVVCKSKKKI